MRIPLRKGSSLHAYDQSYLYDPGLEIAVYEDIKAPELVAVVLRLHVLVELLAEVLLAAQHRLNADVLQPTTALYISIQMCCTVLNTKDIFVRIYLQNPDFLISGLLRIGKTNTILELIET